MGYRENLERTRSTTIPVSTRTGFRIVERGVFLSPGTPAAIAVENVGKRSQKSETHLQIPSAEITISSPSSYLAPATDKGGGVMNLHSDAFENNASIPRKYSCKGEDINPALIWDDVPDNTQSFALSIKDPDAPIGTFVHWLVYDIDKNTRRIGENSIPGKQVTNSFGQEHYGGPCPPSGIHRYFFRLFALDTPSLGKIASMDDFENKVRQHTLAQAELMGKFEKH